jgi:predicted permease
LTLSKGENPGFGRLRRDGVFVFVVIGSLALTLGAATTMFTVLHAFLLSSLPYRNAERLMMIWQHPEQASEGGVDQALPLSPGAYSDLVRRGRSFEQLSAFFSEAVNATESGEVNRLHALFVTGELFPMLGVRAAIGRTLGTGDVRPDAAPAVAISHEFWQRQFGGDPGILDRTLDFGGRTREIVGVLPAGFRFSESLVASDPALSKPIDLWAPLNVEDKANERGFHYLTTIASLSPGVSLETAREELEAYAAVAAEQFPDTDAGYGLSALSLRDQIFGSLRPALLTLGAATLILVLIACVNLATVLLARMYKKRRDTAVRLALGADRPRIVREWLSQSVALSLAGGAVSLCVAFVAIRVLTGLQPVEVFRSYPPRIGPEVILFTFGASLTAGLLFGTMPALLASRTDFPTAMRAGTTRLTGRSRLAFSTLVAAQISLSTALLIGMGLSFKSFQSLLHSDLGIDLENVVTFDLFLPRSKYRDTALKVEFLGELLDRIRGLPSVEAVGMNYALPFSGVNPSNRFEIEGRESREGEILSANLGLVNAGYFQTLGIPLLRGRMFLPGDVGDSTPVAIIDEGLARRYLDGRDPIGRRISIASNLWLTIVGVVGAVQHEALGDEARPYVYLPYQQRSYLFTSIAVKSRLEDPTSLSQPLRRLVSDLDEALPISNLSTLQNAYRKAISPQRFSLALISVLAGVSFFLTVIGVYGVMAFLVRQREQEAGIRITLGASPQQVVGLVVRQGLAVSLAGTAIGLAIAVAAGRVLENLAYGVETLDPIVFSMVAAIALVGAALAYYPAARALSKVEPSTLLRLS